jgi:hypothetical protein
VPRQIWPTLIGDGTSNTILAMAVISGNLF